jgi:NTE family protein
MHVNIHLFVLCLILVLTVVMPEQGLSSPEGSNVTQRPKVALVLSGGGALGLAHIGVLQVLEELHVPVDCVVGTSMGALVGGAYAAGVSPGRMKDVISAADILALFDDDPPRSEIALRIKRDDYRPLFDITFGLNDGEFQLPPGASAGYKFELFLKELIGTGASVSGLNFDELPTPYRATATDLETGKIKVFSSGELARVMRASMSLPAVVAPTVIDGGMYVDGGLVRNLPVDVGRSLCGEILIAVNLGTRPKTKDQIRDTLDVASQSIILLTEQNVENSLAKLTPADVLIAPDLTEFDSSNFSNQQPIIEQGIAAARANKEKLLKLAVSPVEYNNWLATRQRKTPTHINISAITVETTGDVNAKAVRRDITSKAGEEFDIHKLNTDIAEIYGRGDFSYVGYSIITDEENATVVIKAESKPWGPGYLKLGLGVVTDFSSPTQFNLAASYRRTWINALGAEWRTDAQIGYDSFLRTEFIQPLQVRDGAFITPYIGLQRTFVQFYNEKSRLGEIDVRRLQAGLDIGVTGSTGELRIGPYISRIISKPDFGIITPFISEQDVVQAGVVLKGVYDQLDSLAFPRTGLHAAINILTTKEDWGSDDEYTRAQLGFRGVKSFGKNTFSGHLEWGDELSGKKDLPVYDAFKLGGPERLSGLNLDQLTGSHYNLATLSYYRQYASLPSQIGRGLYLGFSLEAGRINDPLMVDPFDWVTSGAVFWGADTVLGAAYIGYGFSSLGQSTMYLVIGPRF